MIYKGPPTIQVWSSGGTVESLQGPLSPARISKMISFFENTASRCLAKGDVHGAKFCTAMLEQIGDACRGASGWRRAA